LAEIINEPKKINPAIIVEPIFDNNGHHRHKYMIINIIMILDNNVEQNSKNDKIVEKRCRVTNSICPIEKN